MIAGPEGPGAKAQTAACCCENSFTRLSVTAPSAISVFMGMIFVEGGGGLRATVSSSVKSRLKLKSD